jgi:hypothetical protein
VRLILKFQNKMTIVPVVDDEMNNYGEAEWSPQPEELDRGRLNQLNPSGKIRWSLRQEIEPGQLAEELAKRLDNASHLLVDRLFSYLSNIPTDESQRIHQNGLTLPASAIGWLSTQMYPRSNEADPLLETQSEAAWMGASMRDRLALLKYLLPRATHLRVTSEEWPPPFRKNTASNRSTDFTGRDVDLSNISVHSGVTMETSFNVATTPSIQSFLLFYNQIQNKPRVDLQVFPNLAVLFLDRIPAEWVVNLVSLHDKLKLIRTERGCIFDMTRFLFGDDEDDDDPLSPKSQVLTKLTYMKINYAALGEMSGLRRGNRRQESDDLTANTRITRPPPLSRLPNLVSLSLAHNEIRTVKTALAGLASLSNLSRLDLAYNQICTMKGANRLLGNIKTLVLTGNSLTNVVGLEKLYSLETLYLGHNELGDVADIAGLGKLPELMNLFVNDNPFVEKDPVRYRVCVLDLFKSTRFYSLLPGATYRQLLQILPVLDGTPATKRELVGLKSLTFRQALPPIETPETQGHAETELDLEPGLESTPQSAVIIEQSMATPVIRSRRVTRKSRRGRAVVSDGQPQHQAESNSALPLKPLELPKIEFSTQDVIASMALQTEPKHKQVKTRGSVSLEPYEGLTHLSFVSISTVIQDEDSIHNMLTDTDILLDQAQAAIDAADLFDYHDDETTLLDNYCATSYIPQLRQATDSEPSATLDESESTQAPRNEAVISESVPTAQVGSKQKTNARWFSTSSSNLDEVTPIRGAKSEKQNSSINPFDDEHQENARSLPMNLDFGLKSPSTGTDFLPRPSVAFPEGVWEDEISLPSSLGTDRLSHTDFLSEDRYREAEKATVYDGPEGYKKLSVVVNLELYFSLFVFPSKPLDASNRFELDEDLSSMAIDASPRIQLRPVDRKVAHNATKEALSSTKLANLGETFKKVWQEDVIACGKSAARRVAPDKKLRRGFHGDPLFLDGSICFTAECRKIIICTSDAAIYLVPGYDPVSMKLVESSSERKFPSPIPQEALFQNGIWPHALARLPIETLKRITIGFSFQRLILHFAPSSSVERSLLGDALTFILATSNRIATVKLLHHLQDLTKTADDLSVGKPKQDVTIDNEDKQVLEALSAAVAPYPVDVVIHYQVLQQRWKHGDRGTVRRACVITDNHIFLLDEDYVGDGSESYDAGGRTLAEVRYSLIDSAELSHIVEVQAASVDPQEITIIIRPQSSFQRNHNWRLFCRDGTGAERLVEDARKAMASVSQET